MSCLTKNMQAGPKVSLPCGSHRTATLLLTIVCQFLVRVSVEVRISGEREHAATDVATRLSGIGVAVVRSGCDSGDFVVRTENNQPRLAVALGTSSGADEGNEVGNFSVHFSLTSRQQFLHRSFVGTRGIGDDPDDVPYRVGAVANVRERCAIRQRAGSITGRKLSGTIIHALERVLLP